MNLSHIEKLQEESLTAAYSGQAYFEPRPCLLSKTILPNQDTVTEIFGEFGKRLYAFFYAVYLSHGELQNRSEGLLDDLLSGETSQLLIEAITVAKFAKSKELTQIIPALEKTISSKLPKEWKAIDDPRNNHQFIRLMADSAVREKLRGIKEVRPVELNAFYKKFNWSNQPDSFRLYNRFNTEYTAEIEAVQKKAARYESLGCKELASGILKGIDDFQRGFEDVYCGFHRITMTNAAVILAKMHGQPDGERNDCPRIFISAKQLGLEKSEQNHYLYAPRAYPYYELEHLAPFEVRRLVTYLERLPELNGGATFDHYVAVVPTAACGTGNLEFPSLHESDDAEYVLDARLIQQKLSIPILLGERDGKCYFICYWI